MLGSTPFFRSQEGRVLAVALASRLAVLALMFAADAAFSDLDSSTHLQPFPCAADPSQAPLPTTPAHNNPFNSLTVWDSVYFVRIAKCGYENDLTNAFFPLLPYTMRYGVAWSGLHHLKMWVTVDTLYAALGFAINFAAFAIAAVSLFRLSLAVLKNATVAGYSVLLFCVNPASVFYSAIYTEAIFAACTWGGLTALQEGHHWLAVAALTVAGASRSNGILAVWFLLHPVIVVAAKERRVPWGAAAKAAISCAFIWSPYIGFQMYGARTYCTHNVPLPWCSKLLPSLYSYVQERYWDVGFLRFYRHPDRWPWLLQSAPVLGLAVGACLAWASADWRRCLTLGVASSRKSKVGSKNRHDVLWGDAVGPFIYHLALMTAAAALVMHVNVATRFLSSSPALYWFAAVRLAVRRRELKPRGAWHAADWVWLWAIASAVLGCLLFPNFFPWT